MEYKIKVSLIAFGLFVALTGSIITVEDWQKFSQEEKIELIMTAEELSEEERTLLLTVLQLEHDDLELQNMAERQARETRLKVSSKLSPYVNEQWRQAASYFENSAKVIQDLRASKKTFETLQKRYENVEIDERTRVIMEKALQDQLKEIEQEGKELHNNLVQAFLAIGLVKKYEALPEDEKSDPKDWLDSILGITTIVVGLIISIITAAKLVIDYRKSRIELALLKEKIN